jgi:hypothetical protein
MSAPAHATDGGRRSPAPSWPRLPASFVAIGAALMVAAALAGWVGRSLGTPEPVAPPAPPRAVTVGPVAMSVPGGWAPEPSAVAGLPDMGARARAFAPVPGLSSRALVVLAPFDDPSLVPAPLRPLVGAAAPRRARLAGLPAWRYPATPLEGGRTSQVTVAPTTAGGVTVVCVAPTAAWAGAAGCADALAGASLRDASPLVPSRTLVFRRELAPVIDRLGHRRAELRGRLRAASTRRAQARFAARLDRAHLAAVSALSPAGAASSATRRVVRTLRASARGYRRLGIAARNGWPVRYRYARVEIRRADRALARGLARVH